MKGRGNGYKYSYHSSFFRANKRSETYEPIAPGPNDLTAEKIGKRMERIHIGDMIKFDSAKEAYNSFQVDRGGSMVKAIAPVVEHHDGYVTVQLHGGLLEDVNYFDIESVNGKAWVGYIRKDSQDTQLEKQGSRWAWR